MNDKKVVDMQLIEKDKLTMGCNEVIDTLSKYTPEYKLAILHFLIKTFPKDYEIIEVQNPKTNELSCIHGRPSGQACPHCLGINK